MSQSARRPNLVYVMFDQLSAQSLPLYGHPLVQAPNLQRLASEGVVFENAYTNYPLCAPARFSMMAGQLATKIAAWDNAAEFPSTVPTFAHYLRAGGYRTCLAGKMHFIGADQLHGYEERVTTDIYPGDFGWTPEWDHPGKILFWYHNMLSVTEAGAYDRSLEMEYDEEVAFQAERWIYEAARSSDDRPFMLTVSFTHPHDPYLAPREYWARYDHAKIDMPAVPYIPPDKRDPLSRRLFDVYDRNEYRVTDEHVRAARHGYYAMITYVDALMANVLRAVKATGKQDDTIIVVGGDHGDMLGERGLWYKMNFFERSMRIPMLIHAPGRFKPRRVSENVSLVDLLPTFLELGGIGERPVSAIDGRSLVPLASGTSRDWSDTVFAEYTAEGTYEPAFMVKRGRFKYVACAGDPPQLFDVQSDPNELDNLADKPEHKQRAQAFAEEVRHKWDPVALRGRIVESQRQRLLVHQAMLAGKSVQLWDYSPPSNGARAYNRNYGGELYDTDRRARLPYRPEPPKDGPGK